MLQGIAQSGAALSGASAIRINVCGPHPIVVHGTDEQKRRWLVPLIKGEEKACFGVTEPDAGLNTAAIKTRAVWDGEKYMVDGRKMWTTTAQEARSEEHTSELQSLMRISYAVFCLKKKLRKRIKTEQRV